MCMHLHSEILWTTPVTTWSNGLFCGPPADRLCTDVWMKGDTAKTHQKNAICCWLLVNQWKEDAFLIKVLCPTVPVWLLQPYYPCQEWATNIPPLVQPNLNYLAPECGLQMRADTSSDMYSLGGLFYVVFNSGRPLFECRGQLATYKKNAKEVLQIILWCKEVLQIIWPCYS